MKQLVTYSLLLFLLAGLFSSCSSKKIPRDLSELEIKIELNKGPCYGTCPVYTLTIYEKGILEYHGIQNVDKMGYFVKRMEKEAFNELINSFETADLTQYEDRYRNPVSDFPTFKLTYLEKSISGNQILPEPVQKLIKELDEITKTGEWQAK
jgi:hypothetical protein